MDINNLVWAEKYRPKTIDEAILPESTKKQIRDAIASNNIPNLLFSGTAGTGKTSLAKIIASQLGADLMFINASLDTGIDAIRMKVIQFSSSVSFSGGPKIVMFDEADGLTKAAQDSLRGVIESFPSTRFIFTCNFKNKIIEAIHSRCVTIDFKTSKEESSKLQAKFFKRTIEILNSENVEFDKAAVAELIKKNYPDFRKTMNELQRYGSSGKIDTGILLNSTETLFKDLLTILQEKNFSEMRKWVGANPDISPEIVFRTIYDMSSELLVQECIPNLVIVLADYLYKSSMVQDQQIIVAAALTEVMSISVWK